MININKNFNIRSDKEGAWNLSDLAKLSPGKYTILLNMNSPDKDIANDIQKLNNEKEINKGYNSPFYKTISQRTTTFIPFPRKNQYHWRARRL